MLRFLTRTALAIALFVPGLTATQAADRPSRASATPAERLKPLKGFQVDLLYSVPKDEQGRGST